MSYLRRNSKIHFRRVGKEILLYDENKNKVIALNETAAIVWNCCDGKHSKEEIVSELMGRYEVTRSKASRDVERTLKRLRSVAAIA